MAKKYRLLVIDDSKETVAGLNSFLSQSYDVLTAYNGLDGLKTFEQHESRIDLVITDLVMPEISGVGVISIIRRNTGNPVVPSPAGASTRRAGDGSGGRPPMIFDKPFELTDLDRHVKELLAKKSR
jgi:response regulator RpfG family c-di-GMP phosphodiesterase